LSYKNRERETENKEAASKKSFFPPKGEARRVRVLSCNFLYKVNKNI